jgi:hypothetical protein
MKYYFLLILVVIISSCNVTETIKIKDNGSGSIVTEENRDEELYKKFAGENYGKNEKSQDTIYFFKDFINKYNKTFFNFSAKDRTVLLTYKDVQVEINKNLKNKIFKTKISQNFIKIDDVPDFYKVEDLAEDLKKNYNLSAEEHYFKLKYSFDGTVFRRIVEITNKENQEKKILEIEDMKAQFGKFPISQNYILNYTFPKKIKYVSNNNAVLSNDKKTMKLEFILSDCIENPDITNLEIVLENN